MKKSLTIILVKLVQTILKKKNNNKNTSFLTCFDRTQLSPFSRRASSKSSSLILKDEWLSPIKLLYKYHQTSL